MLTKSRNKSDNELQVVLIEERFRVVVVVVVVDKSLVEFDDHIGDPIHWRLHDAFHKLTLRS